MFGQAPNRRASARVAKRNHAKENVKAIQEQERRLREARLASEEEKRAYPKLRQFEKVASRHLSKMPATGPRKEYLRRGSRTDAPSPAQVHADKMRSRGVEARTEMATPRKEPLPKSRGRLKPREDVDFVHKNKTIEVATSVRKATDEEEETTKHEDFGSVPAYISQRKAELRAEAERRKAEQPDPNCPEGMARMPESERVEMLEALRAQVDAIKTELDRMPLVLGTLRLAKKKDDLERRLAELETSVAIFERPVVYVKAATETGA